MRAIDRRHLVRGLGSLGGLALLRGSATARRTTTERTLVLLQLSGGNDGLSTVVPYGDDAYHRARGTLHRTGKELLALDGYRGLPKSLKRLHAHYQEGGLAIVEGVGYEDPVRSHFRSLDVWHTADVRGRAAGEGWIGRLCEAAFGDDVRAERVVHVGRNAPYSVYSTRHPALAFAQPHTYRWMHNEEELEGLAVQDASEASDESGAPGPEAATARERRLARLRRVQHDAHASSKAVREAIARHAPAVRYPDEPFAATLRSAAALIHGGIGARVVSLELSGFDTHVDQARRHPRLLALLDEGLDAFLDDLATSEAGREALVLVFSEFGRRVAENGSGGTDHGCAGPMFVAGARVKGGLYGRHPSLTELDEGDLVHTTDFRSVYATAIRSVFDVDPRAVLGADYPLLELV